MSAATRNFSCAQGDYFERTLTPRSSDGVYVDMAGFVLRGQLRKSKSDLVEAGEFTFNLVTVTRDAQTFTGAEMILDDGATGAMTPGKYFYDVFWTPTDNEPERIMQGIFTIEEAATKP